MERDDFGPIEIVTPQNEKACPSEIQQHALVMEILAVGIT